MLELLAINLDCSAHNNEVKSPGSGAAHNPAFPSTTAGPGPEVSCHGCFTLMDAELLPGIPTQSVGTRENFLLLCGRHCHTRGQSPWAPAHQVWNKDRGGAEFIQTQAVYDLDNFKGFMYYVRQFPVKILAGIILLTSAPMARFMNKNVAGVNVPKGLIDEMASAPKGSALAKGIEIAGRMIKRVQRKKCATVSILWPLARKRLFPKLSIYLTN